MTLLTSTGLPPREEEGDGAGASDAGLLSNQRMAKKPTSATARSWGMLIEVSVWAMVAVFVGLVAGRGGWVFARRRSPRVVCSRVAGG